MECGDPHVPFLEGEFGPTFGDVLSLLPLYKDMNAIGIVLEKEDNAKL